MAGDSCRERVSRAAGLSFVRFGRMLATLSGLVQPALGHVLLPLSLTGGKTPNGPALDLTQTRGNSAFMAGLTAVQSTVCLVLHKNAGKYERTERATYCESNLALGGNPPLPLSSGMSAESGSRTSRKIIRPGAPLRDFTAFRVQDPVLAVSRGSWRRKLARAGWYQHPFPTCLRRLIQGGYPVFSRGSHKLVGWSWRTLTAYAV